MIETILFNNKNYPLFQAQGFAAQFAFPYAKQVCSGVGYDIGCSKIEWAFPGSIPIDITFNNGFNAYNLPMQDADYIFSSHCLEHLPDWVKAVEYWYSKLKNYGTLFLYLPDYSQEYWRPWNNKKHLTVFTPQIIQDFFLHLELKNIFVSGIDLNNSFMAIGYK